LPLAAKLPDPQWPSAARGSVPRPPSTPFSHSEILATPLNGVGRKFSIGGATKDRKIPLSEGGNEKKILKNVRFRTSNL